MKSRKIYRQTAGGFFNSSHRDSRINHGFKAMLESPKFLLYACAGVFLLLAVVLGFSIGESLFEGSRNNSIVGDFFADSYGILSFMIPVYLFCAALVLIDKNYKPSRIFLLYCAIFPFMTLAIGFSFLRDYGYFSSRIKLLLIIGKNGFSFVIVCLTALEAAVIFALSSALFPAPPVRRPRAAAREPNRGGNREPNRGGAQFNADVKLLRAPDEKTLNVVREAYTSAFEELQAMQDMQDMEDENSKAVDAAIENLEPNLEILNAKLENLGADMGYMDAAFDKLDANLDALKSELTLMDIPADAYSDAPIEAYGNESEDMEGLEELLGAEYDKSCDVEAIIDMAEAEAAVKTHEAIKKKNHHVVTQPVSSAGKGIYNIPVEGVLREYTDDKYWIIDNATYEAAAILKETLNEFNIQAEVTGIRKGPVITMFEILPSPGVKLSKIVNLQDNIALRLAASSVRIVAPIPGKHAVGIEIPNKKRNIVSFREIIETELLRDGKKPEIPVVLGKDITGEAVTVDLAAMPHLLIAGATGSGKSVCVNTMILSILYQCRPDKCRLILIDPKIVELKLYNDIPHLLTPVITEPKRAFQALQYCIYEMERRYACLDSMGVRDIKTYNKRIKEKKIATEHIPYIVIVIDEFADLMATTGKELESTVARLAAMSRAVGIHLVLATQRPSIDVITGLIKSNIPSRIAFMVASMMDSRIIIDTPGAEKLLGKGDMLYSGIVDPFPVRMQGAFVSEEEVEAVVAHVKTLGEPEYIDDEIFFEDEDATQNIYTEGDDPLYDKAVEIVIQQGKASASYIQRRLKIGYNRAARLVEEMENRGVVGPAQGSRPRELLRAV